MTDVIVLALLSALVGAMLPLPENHSMRKLVTFLSALTVLVAICEPIVRASDRITELPERFLDLLLPDTDAVAEMEAEGEAWVIEYGRERIEHACEKLLCTRFSLPSESLTVAVALATDADGTKTVSGLTVRVRDGTSAAPENIKRYLEDTLACPCTVLPWEDDHEA